MPVNIGEGVSGIVQPEDPNLSGDTQNVDIFDMPVKKNSYSDVAAIEPELSPEVARFWLLEYTGDDEGRALKDKVVVGEDGKPRLSKDAQIRHDPILYGTLVIAHSEEPRRLTDVFKEEGIETLFTEASIAERAIRVMEAYLTSKNPKSETRAA
jgi:hypothetical protein